MLTKAISLAAEAHEGQYRWDGSPYITHPLRVMEAIGYASDSFATAAVLHDTVEDTFVTLDQIKDNFGEEVREIVDCLTKRENETYRNFILRCKKNKGATRIKIRDIEDNLRDLEEGSLRTRYKKALKELYAN